MSKFVELGRTAIPNVVFSPPIYLQRQLFRPDFLDGHPKLLQIGLQAFCLHPELGGSDDVRSRVLRRFFQFKLLQRCVDSQ